MVFLNTTLNQPHVAYPRAKLEVDRVCWEVKKDDVRRDRGYNARTVDGSRSMHSIRSISHFNNVMLECRDFSCFCSNCIGGLGTTCSNSAYVQPWKLITLEPCDAEDVLCDPEYNDTTWGIGGDSNDLAAQLQVGDNFAILAEPNNDEGTQFYILTCVKPMHIVEEDLGPDDFGVNVEKGDEIVQGIYYAQRGMKNTSYVLLRDKGPATMYSHHVIASKFEMVQAPHKQKGGVTVYIGSLVVHMNISLQ